MDSLLPRIWAVEAVGMGASSRLLRTPYLGAHKVGDWSLATARNRVEPREKEALGKLFFSNFFFWPLYFSNN